MRNRAAVGALLILALLAPARSALASAGGPPQIVGTVTQLATNPAGQITPSISGNLVAYTDYRNVNPEVFYYDLAAGTEVQATTSSSVDFQVSGDVSGGTIVYRESSTSGDTVKAFAVGAGSSSDVSADNTANNGAIDGSLVAWEDRRSGVDTQIWAKDLSTGVTKQLSNSPSNISSGANVSGRLVAYTTATATECQVYVTNFDTLATTQLTNSPGCNSSPDISGSRVVYQGHRSLSTQNIFVYDLTTGVETQVPLSGTQQNPHISGDWVSFENYNSAAPYASLMLYNIPTGNVYQSVLCLAPGCTGPTNFDSVFLSDIDGNRVVFTGNASGANHIYLFTFTPPQDFSFSPIAPITAGVGGTASAPVTVNSVNGSSPLVALSVSGAPSGAATSLTSNTVKPPAGGSATATLGLTLSPFVTPGTFTLTVSGTSGATTHTTPATVTVAATGPAITNVVGQLLAAGCINNSGIANALTAKLSAAQNAIAVGNFKPAVNILSAFIDQVQAQSGKHLLGACTISGITFDPAAVLIADASSLIDSLTVDTIPNPITGMVVTGAGAAVAGATVSLVDSSGTTIVAANSDVTGFYFFATTGVLNPGGAYTVAVTGLPSGFTTASAPQAFTWSGNTIALADFVLA